MPVRAARLETYLVVSFMSSEIRRGRLSPRILIDRALHRQSGPTREGRFTLSMSTNRLPALLAMMVGGFAIGATEYPSVDVLPQIVDDFSVDLLRAGLVVSGSALGVSFGSTDALVTLLIVLALLATITAAVCLLTLRPDARTDAK